MPSLIERRGAVVNVSAVGAWQPAGPPLAYNVAKAALKAFGKGWPRSSDPKASASPPFPQARSAQPSGRDRTASAHSSRQPPAFHKRTSSPRCPQ